MPRLLLFLLGSFLLIEVEGWRHFWRGKKFNREEAGAVNSLLPSDQWFEQKLDHFNVINTKTWKQVLLFMYAFYRISFMTRKFFIFLFLALFHK